MFASGVTVQFYYMTSNTQLQTLLMASPLAVHINADSGFMVYSSGVYTCANTIITTSDLNHAVELIGYDASGNWIIKNSWDTTWGEVGYATISSNGPGCGIPQFVYQFSIIDNPTGKKTQFDRRIQYAILFIIGFICLM